MRDVLVTGTAFGDSPNTCYLSIFKSKKADQTTWYLGNLFMTEYYVVYDATPKDERGENYIQMGLGRQNPEQLLGDDLGNVDYTPDVDDALDGAGDVIDDAFGGDGDD